MSVKETLQRTANNRKAEITKRNEELDKIKARLDALEKINDTRKSLDASKYVWSILSLTSIGIMHSPFSFL